ncbi:hypothetical protein KAW80_04130 [Candidatus Babeliales bacterium]|nr:hypothetical protein [Candidatus Babeliales bacterium]
MFKKYLFFIPFFFCYSFILANGKDPLFDEYLVSFVKKHPEECSKSAEAANIDNIEEISQVYRVVSFNPELGKIVIEGFENFRESFSYKELRSLTDKLVNFRVKTHNEYREIANELYILIEEFEVEVSELSVVQLLSLDKIKEFISFTINLPDSFLSKIIDHSKKLTQKNSGSWLTTKKVVIAVGLIAAGYIFKRYFWDIAQDKSLVYRRKNQVRDTYIEDMRCIKDRRDLEFLSLAPFEVAAQARVTLNTPGTWLPALRDGAGRCTIAGKIIRDDGRGLVKLIRGVGTGGRFKNLVINVGMETAELALPLVLDHRMHKAFHMSMPFIGTMVHWLTDSNARTALIEQFGQEGEGIINVLGIVYGVGHETLGGHQSPGYQDRIYSFKGRDVRGALALLELLGGVFKWPKEALKLAVKVVAYEDLLLFTKNLFYPVAVYWKNWGKMPELRIYLWYNFCRYLALKSAIWSWRLSKGNVDLNVLVSMWNNAGLVSVDGKTKKLIVREVRKILDKAEIKIDKSGKSFLEVIKILYYGLSDTQGHSAYKIMDEAIRSLKKYDFAKYSYTPASLDEVAKIIEINSDYDPLKNILSAFSDVLADFEKEQSESGVFEDANEEEDEKVFA